MTQNVSGIPTSTAHATTAIKSTSSLDSAPLVHMDAQQVEHLARAHAHLVRPHRQLLGSIPNASAVLGAHNSDPASACHLAGSVLV